MAAAERLGTGSTKSKKAEPKRNRGYASFDSLDVLHRNYARDAQDATQWKAVGGGENDAKGSEAAPNITVSLAMIDLSYAESVVSQRALMLNHLSGAIVPLTNDVTMSVLRNRRQDRSTARLSTAGAPPPARLCRPSHRAWIRCRRWLERRSTRRCGCGQRRTARRCSSG